jgi:hypothetical protein
MPTLPAYIQKNVNFCLMCCLDFSGPLTLRGYSLFSTFFLIVNQSLGKKEMAGIKNSAKKYLHTILFRAIIRY